MEDEPKRRRASVAGNPGNDAVDEPKGHRIGYQKEDESRVEGEFHFQTCGERHIIMWVIFRDPKTAFNHADKFVIDLVEDKDILTYQATLHKVAGGRTFPLDTDARYNQKMVTSSNDIEYFARRYSCWDPEYSTNGLAMDAYIPGNVLPVVHVLRTIRYDGNNGE